MALCIAAWYDALRLLSFGGEILKLAGSAFLKIPNENHMTCSQLPSVNIHAFVLKETEVQGCWAVSKILGHHATKSFLHVSCIFNARSVTKSLLTSVWFSRFLDEGKSFLPEVSKRSPRRGQGKSAPGPQGLV